jgi:hypothetical protein
VAASRHSRGADDERTRRVSPAGFDRFRPLAIPSDLPVGEAALVHTHLSRHPDLAFKTHSRHAARNGTMSALLDSRSINFRLAPAKTALMPAHKGRYGRYGILLFAPPHPAARNGDRHEPARTENCMARSPDGAHCAPSGSVARAGQPNACFTRSGVNGVCRSRTPVSSATALPITGATNGVAIWPAPVGWLSVTIRSICIRGTWFMRGRW